MPSFPSNSPWISVLLQGVNRVSLMTQMLTNLNLPAKQETQGSVPGSGRAPGEGNGNPLQYFCLGNPMDREAWQATVHGVAKEFDIT